MARIDELQNGQPRVMAERYANREASAGGVPYAMALNVAKNACKPPAKLPKAFATKPQPLKKGSRRK